MPALNRSYAQKTVENGMSFVGLSEVELTEYMRRGILQREATGQHIVSCAIGSLCTTLVHQFNLPYYHLVAHNPVAEYIGGSVTHPNVTPLEDIERKQPWNDSHRDGRWVVDHASRLGRLVSQRLGRSSSSGGYGANPEEALHDLQTNPTIIRGLEELRLKAQAALVEYGLTKASVLSSEGGGGTLTLHKLFLMMLERLITFNLFYRLIYMAPPDMFLHVRNLQGELANLLLKDADASRLVIAAQLQHAGPHAWDPALAAGVLTLVAVTAEGDPVTTMSVIKSRSSFLEARPAIVDVPTSSVGSSFWRRNSRERVLRHTEAGGVHVDYINDQIGRYVRTAPPEALHVIAVCGYLTPSDIELIHDHARMLAHWPGQVHILTNPMLSEVPDIRARYFLTDFVASPYLPRPYTAVFGIQDKVTREELLERIAGDPAIQERARRSAEIEERLSYILSTRA